MKFFLLFFGLMLFSAQLLCQSTANEVYSQARELASNNEYLKAAETLCSIDCSKESVELQFKFSVAIGIYYLNVDIYDKAAEYFEKAAHFNTKNKTIEYSYFLNYGMLNRRMGNYNAALLNYHKALGIANRPELCTDSFFIVEKAELLRSIGIAYQEIEDYESAGIYYVKALEFRTKHNLPTDGFLYSSIASNFRELNKYAEAEFYVHKAIEIFKEDNSETSEKLYAPFIIYARLLYQTNRRAQSHTYLQRAVGLFGHAGIEHSPQLADSYYHLADFYKKEARYAHALWYCRKAMFANAPGFSDCRALAFPEYKSVLSPIHLLRTICVQGEAYADSSKTAASTQHKRKLLSLSEYTLRAGMRYISKLKSNYSDADNKLYVADNEKNINAVMVNVFLQRYELDGTEACLDSAYTYVCRSKASVLLGELNLKDLRAAYLPADVQKRYNDFEQKISSFNFQIHDIIEKSSPDSAVLKSCRDSLLLYTNLHNQLNNSVLDNSSYADKKVFNYLKLYR